MAVTASKSSLTVSFQSLSIDGLRDKLAQSAIGAMKNMAEDTADRLKSFTQKISSLASGVFPQDEYYKALRKVQQTPRLQYLVKVGAFLHGLAPSEAFELVPSLTKPTGYEMSHFVLKKGVKPSEGLKAIRTGLSLLGVGEVCQIAYYTALQELLGTEKFDLLFAQNSPTPMRVCFNAPQNPIKLLTTTIPVARKTEVAKGRILFFQNASSYYIKHFNGDAACLVAICNDDTTGHELFTAIGLASGGATISEIQEKLLKELNEPPLGIEAVTSEVAKKIIASYSTQTVDLSKKLAEKTFSLEEFTKERGGEMCALQEFNVVRIKKLVEAPLEKARALFTKWAYHAGILH